MSRPALQPVIVEAHEGPRLECARQLLRAYVDSLDVSLDFQDFEAEILALPGKYEPPEGCLLLAIVDDQSAGCIALRRFADGICEMKRLYTRPEFRGQRIGAKLVHAIIRQAKARGYAKMRLDTLPSMHHARKLYAGLGFREIAPYYENPVRGTTYLELDLACN